MRAQHHAQCTRRTRRVHKNLHQHLRSTVHTSTVQCSAAHTHTPHTCEQTHTRTCTPWAIGLASVQNQARTRTHTHSQCCTHTHHTRLHEMYAASAACILTRACMCNACTYLARAITTHARHIEHTHTYTKKNTSPVHTRAQHSTAQHSAQ